MSTSKISSTNRHFQINICLISINNLFYYLTPLRFSFYYHEGKIIPQKSGKVHRLCYLYILTNSNLKPCMSPQVLAELCGIGVVQWVKLVKKAAYFTNVLFKTIYFMNCLYGFIIYYFTYFAIYGICCHLIKCFGSQ